MFKGDWYDQPEIMKTKEEAIAKAAGLTLANYREWKLSWEEYGYEWSVFEKEDESEKKIWEGFKYIYQRHPKKSEVPDINLGNV